MSRKEEYVRTTKVTIYASNNAIYELLNIQILEKYGRR